MVAKLLGLLPDRWSVVELSGAGLLGGGVWSVWGVAWACMLWGALLLGVCALRAWVLYSERRRAAQAGGSE